VTFDPKSLPATVSTTRILCLACYEKRQAEKAAAKAKAAGSSAPAPATAAPAPKAAAASSAVPPAAAAPVAKAATAPPPPRTALTPAPAPAPAHAPRVAAPPPAPSAPAGSAVNGSTRKVEDAGATKHAVGSGSKVGSASKFSSSSASRHGPKKKAEPEAPIDRKAELRAQATQMMDKQTKRGLVIGIVFLLCAGAYVYYVLNSKKVSEQAAVAYEKGLDDFLSDMKKYNADTVDGARQLQAATDISKAKWTGTRISSDINTMRVKAQLTLQADLDRQQFNDRLTSLEAQAKDIAAKTAEELRIMRKSADALALEAQAFGPDAVTRITSLRSTLQTNIGTKLKEEAITFADTNGGTDALGALQKLGSAEDDLRELYEAADKEKNAQGKTLFYAYLQELYVRTDKLANLTFNEAAVAAKPWLGLLDGAIANEWKFSGVKGSIGRIEAGRLVLAGGDAESKARTVNSIGDSRQWRDFVIEGEFTIESGSFTMAFRLGKRVDNITSDTVIVTADEGRVQAGGTYSFTYQLIGSTAKMTWKDDIFEAVDRELDTRTNRHGAFGLVLNTGTKVTFTRLRVKELR
jgi:hypothetical protein